MFISASLLLGEKSEKYKIKNLKSERIKEQLCTNMLIQEIFCFFFRREDRT